MRRKRRTGLIVSCSAVARRRFCGVRCRPTSAPLLVTLPTGLPRTSRRRSTISDVLLRTYPCLVSCLERRRHCHPFGHVRIVMTSLVKSCSFDPVPTFWYGSLLTCFYHTSPAWSIGQCVVGRRLPARLTKARDCFASAEKARPVRS